MSWVRSGDNSATYPALLEVAARPDADERTLNEVAGFIWRCAAQTASHETDYFLLPGTAALIGGARTRSLIETGLAVGLLIAGSHPKTGKDGWFIVEDDDFLHMVKSDEKAWENQQRNDSRDPALKVPLLLRDGLLCRFCAVRTRLTGRPSKRTFTVHHLRPGEAAKDVTQVVVACMGCNSAIREDVDGSWARQHPLMPPPRQPYIDKAAAEYLTKEGYPMSPTSGPAPDVQEAVHAVTDPQNPTEEVASSRRNGSQDGPSSDQGSRQSAVGASDPKSLDKSLEKDFKGTFEGVSPDLSSPTKPTYAGSGRVGSGLVGQERNETGRNGPVKPAPTEEAQPLNQSRQGPPGRRRRRRGGRGNSSQQRKVNE